MMSARTPLDAKTSVARARRSVTSVPSQNMGRTALNVINRRTGSGHDVFGTEEQGRVDGGKQVMFFALNAFLVGRSASNR